MKLKRLFIAALLVIGFATTINAQQYNTALGVRLGYDNGITLKHFFAPASAGEFMLYASSNYVQLTGMYQYQQPLPNAANFEWYVGLGGHVGAIHKNRSHYNNSLLVGADLIGGIEYIFPTAPFTVSLDWKPSFNFTNNYNDDWYSGFALSLRYVLK